MIWNIKKGLPSFLLPNNEPTKKRTVIFGYILGTILGLAPAHTVFAIGYTVTLLPSLEGGYSGVSATAISDSGYVSGTSGLTSGVRHAVRWKGSVITDIDSYAIAYGVNSAGDTVGSTMSFGGAFLYDGNLTSIGSGGSAKDINDAGQIIINGTNSSGNTAYFYDNGVLTDLGGLGGQYSTADAINNAGQVVGYIYNYPVSGQVGIRHRAFIWKNGEITVLEPIGANGNNGFSGMTYAKDINDAGQVVGTTSTDAGTHYFLWDNGNMIDLGIATIQGNPIHINNSGIIVTRSVLYNNGVITDAKDLLPPDIRSEYFGFSIVDINNAGQIVGNGLKFDLTTYETEYNSLVLTPIAACY